MMHTERSPCLETRRAFEKAGEPAIGVGVAMLFMEVHDHPDNAASFGPNSLRLDQLKLLLSSPKTLDSAAKQSAI